jgi:hypothetical protein
MAFERWLLLLKVRPVQEHSFCAPTSTAAAS